MRILLINVPVRENAQPNVFPTGLGMIAAVLVEAGHDVRVLDLNALRPAFERAVEMALAEPVDAFGISGLVSTFAYQERLMAALKEGAPDSLIIAGGGCATSVPELMLDNMPVDYLVLGEGEHTVVELCAQLDAGASSEDLTKLPGLALRVEGKTVKTAPRPLEPNLDSFPMPAYDLFPVEVYLHNSIWTFEEDSLNIIGSRGCPMSCNFCYSLFGQRSYRTRSAENIGKEVRYLIDTYGVKRLAFADDNVTINRRHLKEVCAVLKETDLVEWGCHGRVDTADDDRLATMKDARCTWLGFGIESGSQRILNAMNKKVKVKQALEAIERTRNHGIFANCTFINGYPGEDIESIRESMRFKLEIGLFSRGFLATPYPGTQLYQWARDNGRIPDELAFVRSLNDASDFTVNLTDFSDDDLVGLVELANAELYFVLSFCNGTIARDELPVALQAADTFICDKTLLPESKSQVLQSLVDSYKEHELFEEVFELESLLHRLRMTQEAPQSALA